MKDIEEMLVSGKSVYSTSTVRGMMAQIKKTTKEELDAVKLRVFTAKIDMAY